MTMEEMLDREAIRLLMATYTINGDRGRIATLADVFAEDGILEFSGEQSQGRQTILRRLDTPGQPRDPRHSFTRHNLTSSLVELDGEGATGRTYFQVMTDIGLDHHGHYADRFVRTSAGWKIAHRQVRIDWQSPDSLYPTFPKR
ncbi:nuclear transport factor 2 family protein [Sphingobium sp. Z007]|uniref:nuclear transport factor 2 family protein n=1 Tax=Sphingobium sp. Z007 TaxID=627495 RepID=UPI000B49F909|nr:nuclear transport factor 2 family protein [Sphingobium sp. Z007]